MALSRSRLQNVKDNIKRRFIGSDVARNVEMRKKFFEQAPPGSYKVSMFISGAELRELKNYLRDNNFDFEEYNSRVGATHLRLRREKLPEIKPVNFDINLLDIPGV